MAEHVKAFFDREVQIIHDLHQFPEGNGGIVLVQAPTPLQAINGWAAVVDADPDQLSNDYEGKRILVVCDEEVVLPVDNTVQLGEKYRFVELERPDGVIMAFRGHVPKPIHNLITDLHPIKHGVEIYVVPPKKEE